MSTLISVQSDPALGRATLVEFETYTTGKDNKIEKVLLAHGESIELLGVSSRTIRIKEVVT